jgi:hypothetical protein
MITKNKAADIFTTLFPYLLILIALLGVGLVLLMHNLSLLFMGSALIVPLLLSGVIILRRKKKGTDILSLNFDFKIGFLNLVLIYFILFVISIIILTIFAERQPIYFLVISLVSGVLLLQIIHQQSHGKEYFILFEMILLSLNLIWGVALKYPLYFAGTDIMNHLGYIESIVTSGHTFEIGTDYRYFPAYHVFNAIGTEITGMYIKNANIIIMGLAWQGATIYSYLIFKRLSGSSRLALLACLLFIVDETEVYFGSYAIARSLAFVLFMGWLYLAINLSQKKIQYVPLILITTLALILTHHTTIITVAPVLIVFYICQKIFYGVFNRNSLIQSAPIFLLIVGFFSYLIWVATSLFAPLLPNYYSLIIQADSSIKINPRMVSGGPMSFIFNSLFFSLVLIFVPIGISTAWNWWKASHRLPIYRTIALAALLFLILYLPYPLGFLPQTQLTFSERFPLLVLPFMAFVMAYGIYYLMGIEFGSRLIRGWLKGWPVGTTILVSAATFFSIVTSGNAQDSSILPNSYDTGSTYFTSAELDSLSFINQVADPQITFYSDYFVARNQFYLYNLTQRDVFRNGDLSNIGEGYGVLRTAELEKRGGLTFSPVGTIAQIMRYHIDPEDPKSNILINLSDQNAFYSNGSVQIYFINKHDSSPD